MDEKSPSQRLYEEITATISSKGGEQQIIEKLCNLLNAYCGSSSMRISFDGMWFCSTNFAKTDNWRKRVERVDNVFEYYYADDESRYDEVSADGSLDIATQLVMSYLSGELLRRLSYIHRERKKELAAINHITSITNRGLSISETLSRIAQSMPLSWQYPDSTRVRISFEGKDYLSTDFAESRWMQKESFVTLDDKKGVIQVYYVDEHPTEFDGPFLKEECQLISNIAKMVCGYINNYKGREIYNNIHHATVVSNGVTEDFRKTLTRTKQPLQLFFNKQIIEKYVYLDMMKYKVKNILFVATLYDAFILENDDSFFEQFMGEIYQYSLFSLPRITGVTTSTEALELMKSTHFDLAILMVGLDVDATVKLSADIKEQQAEMPVYLLLNQTNNVKYFEQLAASTPSIDKLFVWSGNSQILFSIVKSIEDNANVENDTKIGLVRVILLVEDSPIYYSKYLQILFSEVFSQIQQLIVDERNEINKISKMRQRPKILHARNYEDAMYIFEKYKDFLLCVISDVEFERNGTVSTRAGIDLVSYMLSQMPQLPAVLQTADLSNASEAERLGVPLLNKHSDNLQSELISFLTSRLGFGDFYFRNHNGTALAQAKTLKEFGTVFRNLPKEFLYEYGKDHRISSWLMSRGEIPLARAVFPIVSDDYPDLEDYRTAMLNELTKHTANRRRGKRIVYDEIDVPDEKNIITLAAGSLGGKGRGLAFINTLIQNIDTTEFDAELNIRIPITAVIGTEEFVQFMERGNLWIRVNDGTKYEELRRLFAKVPLSEILMKRITRFAEQIHKPIAVRSSSLSEDSMNQPFAGVFDTYIVPNNKPNINDNVADIATAIKMVYVSIYSETSRGYFQTIRRNVDEEKMAVVLQVLVGSQHEDYFYPHVAGTAQSYNYYPVAHMQPDEGFAVAGFGLGYYVVGGSKAYRFSPAWPKIDISSTADAVKNTQVEFLALDLKKNNIDYVADGEHAPLATLDISEAEHHGTLKHCASVYNPQNDTIEPGLSSYGPRIVNFANILKYDYVPLAKVLSMLLTITKEAMGSPVELEWAVDLNPAENGLPSFYLLQMKPIITELQNSSVEIGEVDREKAILYTTQSLGNGDVKNITDIIYADPTLFNKMETEEMAQEIDYLNSKMANSDSNYILIGPGRWGTRDKFIGIPVQWSQISKAKLIVEISLPGFPLDSSLGSHFFHNVTSMNIGYASVQESSVSDFVNWDNITKMQLIEQTKHFRHVRCKAPLVLKMNGKERRAMVAFRSDI
ncbi:MAG: pyruvate, phosphate dikinase [Bacteroidales bacterium]|jgi:hypothetical protein|nr:pyruvate, phosphate dikinase [Bacteroidales bacterium]